jgi:DNA-binding NtrC family response regulator
MAKPRALLVEDDPSVRSTLTELLQHAGFEADAVGSAAEARRHVADHTPDLAVLDLVLPDADGVTLLSDLRSGSPELRAIMVTGHMDPRSIVAAMRGGALDYLSKPVDPEVFMRLCRSAVADTAATSGTAAVDALVGGSPWTTRMKQTIERLARTRPTGALVSGEPGAGKTHLARVLHAATGRSAHPCLAYACGDSANPSVDLFGAATTSEAGLTTAVQGGTLILDDVEKLDARLQERLTNWIASLAEASGGTPLVIGLTTGMRRDAPLLDWLGRVAMGIPPLRERTADIEPLARHFLAQSAAMLGRPFEGFTRGAIHRLIGHVWPGNVRELAQAVAQAAQAMPGGALHADHFLASERGSSGPAWAPTGEPRPLREIEDAYIDHVIGLCGGNKTRAAKVLGVARETLRIRLTARQSPA